MLHNISIFVDTTQARNESSRLIASNALSCNFMSYHLVIFMHCYFMPCHLVHQFRVLHFHVRHLQRPLRDSSKIVGVLLIAKVAASSFVNMQIFIARHVRTHSQDCISHNYFRRSVSAVSGASPLHRASCYSRKT